MSGRHEFSSHPAAIKATFSVPNVPDFTANASGWPANMIQLAINDADVDEGTHSARRSTSCPIPLSGDPT
jgi:hypothetical protein